MIRKQRKLQKRKKKNQANKTKKQSDIQARQSGQGDLIVSKFGQVDPKASKFGQGDLHASKFGQGDPQSSQSSQGNKSDPGDLKDSKLGQFTYISSENEGLLCFRKCRESTFETKNTYVQQHLTEEEINRSEFKSRSVPNKKIRCTTCGYKSLSCLKIKCKALGKICYACSKPNHFPKSPNCTIQRAKKKEKLKSKTIYGCLTLRNFLKISGYKIKSRVIPYNKLSGKNIILNNKAKHKVNKDNPIKRKFLQAIKEKVSFIEKQLYYNLVRENCPYSIKFFLISYFLFNLQHLYIRTETNKEFLNKQAAVMESHKCIFNGKCEHCENCGFPESIKTFFKISSDTTQCLENFVETHNNKNLENQKMLHTRIAQHENNVNKFAEKLQDIRNRCQETEILRSDFADNFDASLNASNIDQDDNSFICGNISEIYDSNSLLEKNICSSSEDDSSVELNSTMVSEIDLTFLDEDILCETDEPFISIIQVDGSAEKSKKDNFNGLAGINDNENVIPIIVEFSHVSVTIRKSKFSRLRSQSRYSAWLLSISPWILR